ncbi:UDP-N-acetylglucosamine 2-epimerase (non-hydrolyzing) [Oceanidesulfovibrio marinus]|uniref:UDP-N-acetylglucosamine 2-epimerase (non-hydrolyzing) n=2 Tax=Oceanidesulfovibrio marinus TaxID=370038 RepID=A0A6P1ZKM9_9BACT|nr:UDP-N-acetylglucosamine 2-epimerase (non-hydrolyzing) [Oceanidesulfovibrio marinus]TVM36143.1 UDP-N-acetylglucosamine 2-epimerase (non-hydrolyzing) [Oceanidesulfovibrio marinus]
MTNICLFAGTRPEVIKLAPVFRMLRADDSFSAHLILTGQHTDILEQAMRDMELEADANLHLMTTNQTLNSLTAKLLSAVDVVLENETPDWVLVQGDTTTAMTCAMAAFHRQIRVGHVEAGLRSYNRFAPYPEEVNRRIISTMADLHCAPTEEARSALLSEGVPDNNVIVSGNTVVDALSWMSEQLKSGDTGLPIPFRTALEAGRRVILVTSHRREAFGQGLKNICQALRILAQTHDDIHVLYPTHPNPNVLGPVQEMLGGVDRISLIDPVGYREMIAMMLSSHLLLTDSGGVQEEGLSLDKPVLVMREVTERPEGIAAGGAKLVGVDCDRIVNGVGELLTDENLYRRMAEAKNPYGDGRASERIIEAIKSFHA